MIKWWFSTKNNTSLHKLDYVKGYDEGKIAMEVNKKHIKKYQQYMNQKQYSENTKKQYMTYAKQLKNKKIDQSLIDEITENCSNVQRSFLRGWIDCFNLDLEVINPTGQEKQKTIVYFTEDEIQQLLENSPTEQLYWMMRLMYEIGLRISELINLERKNFDLINGEIHGTGKGNKEFKLPLFEDTLEEITPYIDRFDIHEKPFSYEVKHPRQKAYYKIRKHINNILPYKDIEGAVTHAFRHTCATQLLQKGLNTLEIKDVLRHKDLSTVQRYAHVQDEQLRKKWEEAIQ